jgi:hypothetical protein
MGWLAAKKKAEEARKNEKDKKSVVTKTSKSGKES